MIFLRADRRVRPVLDKPSASGERDQRLRARECRGRLFARPGVDFTSELVNLIAFNGSTVPSGLTNHLLHTVALSVRTPGENQFHFGSCSRSTTRHPRRRLGLASSRVRGYQRDHAS